MQFAKLVIGGEKRAELHRAERLSRIHDRIVHRFSQIDNSADLVEQAAADLAEAANQPADMPSGWTLGL